MEFVLKNPSCNPALNIYRGKGIFKGKRILAHPQFFPLTLARSKRGEGPSRTLNKGVALLWFTGGLLSSLPAYLQLPAIPLRNPSNRSLARRLPPIQRARRPFPSLWLFSSAFVGARGRRVQKASSGNCSSPKFDPLFRKMWRAHGRPAGRPYKEPEPGGAPKNIARPIHEIPPPGGLVVSSTTLLGPGRGTLNIFHGLPLLGAKRRRVRLTSTLQKRP